MPVTQWERLLDTLSSIKGCPEVIKVASWAERRYPKAVVGRHSGANVVHGEDMRLQVKDLTFTGDEFMMDMIFAGIVTVDVGKTQPRILLPDEDVVSEKQGRLALALDRATSRLQLAASTNANALVDLDKLTAAQLRSIATELGLSWGKRALKPELRDLVRARWPEAHALAVASIGKNKAKKHPTEKRDKDSAREDGEPASDSGDSDAGDDDGDDNDDDDKDDQLDTEERCRKCKLAWDNSKCIAKSARLGKGDTYFTCMCGGGEVVCKSNKCSWAEGTYRSIVVFA